PQSGDTPRAGTEGNHVRRQTRTRRAIVGIPRVVGQLVPPRASANRPGRSAVGGGHVPLRDRTPTLDSAATLGGTRRACRGKSGANLSCVSGEGAAAGSAEVRQTGPRGTGEAVGESQWRGAGSGAMANCGATEQGIHIPASGNIFSE